MQQDVHQHNREAISQFRAALYDCDPAALRRQLHVVCAPECKVHLGAPIEDVSGGPDGLFEQGYRPLLNAMPDLERRDFIVIAGRSDDDDWVGCAGHYLGTFEQPWLDIPPTRRAVAMRYHEFFRVADGRVVEIQALWDIPQLMMQADAWPMTPCLGVNWLVPGPATQDGVLTAAQDPAGTDASLTLVRDMLTDMGKHPRQGGPEIMRLEHYWHPKMNWYGPAGIGTARGIAAFRRQHQIPFLKALPDRRVILSGHGVMFAEGAYVATAGLPNMQMTVTGDGWLGIAPGNQTITMRSFDFWRCENGLIRENWVLVDLLNVYQQIGVDVFSRMREVTYARQPRTS